MKAIPVYVAVTFMVMSSFGYAQASSNSINSVRELDLNFSNSYTVLPDGNKKMLRTTNPGRVPSIKERVLDRFLKRFTLRTTLYTPRPDGTGYPGSIKLTGKAGWPNKFGLRATTCPYEAVCVVAAVNGKATPDLDEAFGTAWFRVTISF